MLELEDLKTGSVLPLGSYEVRREEVFEFAEEFDPQPFHLDEEAARNTMLGGLSASGWHTCSIMMRLMCDALMSRVRSQGSPGVDFVKWRRPVRPGDVLSGDITITETRVSASRPGIGIVKLVTRLVNQKDEPVLEMQSSIFVQTREGALS